MRGCIASLLLASLPQQRALLRAAITACARAAARSVNLATRIRISRVSLRPLLRALPPPACLGVAAKLSFARRSVTAGGTRHQNDGHQNNGFIGAHCAAAHSRRFLRIAPPARRSARRCESRTPRAHGNIKPQHQKTASNGSVIMCGGII